MTASSAGVQPHQRFSDLDVTIHRELAVHLALLCKNSFRI